MNNTVAADGPSTDSESHAMSLQERSVLALERSNAIRASMARWMVAGFVLLTVLLGTALAGLWHQSAETARAARQQTTASIYTLGLDMDKLAIQTPEFRHYFAPSGDYFAATKLPSGSHQAAMTKEEQEKRWKEGQLNCKKEFDEYTTGTSDDPKKRAAEEADKRVKVWACAGFQADYMEYVFVHRELFAEDDWKGWWQWMCQEYDDCPILRQFLERYEETDWFTFLPAVRSTVAGRKRYSDKRELSGRQL